MHIRLPHVALVGVLALALTGGAVAALPSGAISACVTKGSGAVRIVEGDAQCAATETPLSWNQAGKPGPAGPSFVHAVRHESPFRGGYTKVLTLDLPANGHFQLAATAKAFRNQAAGSVQNRSVNCDFMRDDQVLDAQLYFFHAGSNNRTQLRMEGLTSTGATPGSVSLYCATSGGPVADAATLYDLRITATRVGGFDQVTVA